MTDTATEKTYPTAPCVNKGPLPDLFVPPEGGRRIARPDEWPALAKTWRDRIVDLEYGGMPPSSGIRIETLCHSSLRSLPGTPGNWSYKIHIEDGDRPLSFCVRLLIPKTDAPVPVIINGDDCWWYINDDIVRQVLDAGCALAIFNRTELAEDLGYPGDHDRTVRAGGLYDVFPGRTFGALAAWAWGYHRCVDLLRTLPFIDVARIAITGHSRGGKTTLLAGATDERIALVNDNASCAGGGAAFRYVGDSGETLNIANVFPSWFGPELQSFVGREDALPFDQHMLLAAIAPRPLLLTYALDDRWSNPEGMIQCAWAAGEAYRFLGRPNDLAFHLRPGGHGHTAADWAALLDFIGWKWNAVAPTVPFNVHPYAHLTPAFDWRAP